MRITFILCCLISISTFAQRDRQGQAPATAHDHAHHVDENEFAHNHLDHIQAYRKETAYVHNLPPAQFLEGIGTSTFKISTKSEQAQKYFAQGVALLHDFWDFEAYRSFKEAIRLDSSAVMPYWGLYSAIGATEGPDFDDDKKLAVRKLKALRDKANEHEKLYAEAILLRDAPGENSRKQYQQKLEIIVHKYPEDVDAKLFLALSKMSGYDVDLNPREGQIYSEYLLRDVLKSDPDNAGAHHYWIHLMENCCPDEAIKSSERIRLLTPGAAHMVHMPGHVYYKLGQYQKAHEAFLEAVAVDSVYMKKQGIPEVDTWNYIHNINYLLSNSAENGHYKTALYYAEKLQNMPVTRERKAKYEGRFFYQGIIAPAKMELCFGYYKKAADRLKLINDKDSIFTGKAIGYKDGLYYFALGMDAVKRGKADEARKYSDALDAHLYRNSTQSSRDDVIAIRRLGDLNVASLELQGLIQSLENNDDEAIRILKTAQKKEHDLGYSEPPSYARPVLISLGEVYTKAGKYDLAIKAYEDLAQKRPNSANALWGLYKVYKKKGDAAKAKELAAQLNEVIRQGDKSLYPL
ncbi:Tetratricopeptide repeat-containing protein [Dyadobacter soli]|uniref:Tetratricopeptide repeat-containing protein n=1 Tax=Dyadobacter soli TaxID=659014 RepID=A0A1G7SBB7_9BACT|nr:tetratricopeptide repeat protein [Dyadobacter soli]SDG20283.1 Tetratricopeptide repeat-containing protein [Dyadobacter soli]